MLHSKNAEQPPKETSARNSQLPPSGNLARKDTLLFWMEVQVLSNKIY